MDKLFRRRAFSETIWKPSFFGGQVSFIVANIWLIILYWASHYQLADLICIFNSIPHLAHFFLFFTNFLPKKNCAKNEFSTDLLQNLKFKRLSMLQGLAYHMNRKTVLLRFTKLSSDANLHFERMFLFGFLLKMVKQQISFLFDYISKKFYGIVQIMNLNRNS